ncbi:redoxin domain-containing protein [Bacillus sp. AGMB 02131]|uniref:Redoxin domain-containing protein n=1 Tax=Peribacillus faecalis TaxID=2772559 RepID=A0A927HAA1_9BACI|nr:redoxin domain-containing protein [Peribacillus faecalis]MBD3107332.1 redoxin domain-containing protein [Peribacillus faecalis]
MVKKVAAGAVLVLLIVIAMVQALEAEQEETSPGLKTGIKAPDFSLQTLNGESVKLSDYEGKKVVLNFWATWCKPCREEMPDLQAVYSENKEDVVILAVNMDAHNDVKGFTDQYAVTFPVLLDEEDEVSERYQVISLPTTYFIDVDGKIAKKHLGQITDEQLEDVLNEI